MKTKLTDEKRQKIVSRLLFELNDGGNDGKFARSAQTVLTSDSHVGDKNI